MKIIFLGQFSQSSPFKNSNLIITWEKKIDYVIARKIISYARYT